MSAPRIPFRVRSLPRVMALLLGAALCIAGIAAIYPPAALIAAGALLVAISIEVPGR
jgi:hypothetical protein